MPVTYRETVPTANDRQGILTDPVLHPKPIIDPETGMPFPNNTIPPQRIDPIAKNILRIIPEPTTTSGYPNHTVNTGTDRPYNQINVRVDQNFGSFARLFGRYSVQPSKYFTEAFGTIDPSSSSATNTNIVAGFDANTARFFNSVRFGHTRQNNKSENLIPAGITPASLGFPLNAYQPNPLGPYFGIPAFSITGYGEVWNAFGQRGGTPGGGHTRVWEFVDTMTLVRGAHTFSWGGAYMRTSIFNIFSNNERGTYGFDGTYTGDALADFLLGLPRNLSRDVATPTPLLLSNSVFTHFGDNWKVSRNLTIDFGLAYSYNGQPYEVKDQIGSFFIGPIDGVQRLQWVFGGDPRFPRSLMYANLLDFDPRLGIAWSPFGSRKTVIRIGAGRFHSALTVNDRLNNAFGPPFGVSQSFQNPIPPVATLANAFLPSLIGGPTATSRRVAAPMHFKDAAIDMWNLNIQREIGPGMLLQVSYVGNTAYNLDCLTYFNAARPGPGPFAPRRPFPLDPGPIFYGETKGVSTYHAFRAQVEKRMSRGFTLLSYYNFAKHLDNATALADGFGGQYFLQDGEDPRADKGRSSDDARHRWVTSYVYQVPLGKGRSYLSSANPVLDGFVGGWQLAGVVTLMSGMPWSASQPGNRANRDAGIERPDRVCDGNLGSARTLAKWFDTSCYVLSPLYKLGNAGRNTIEGPGLVNLDLNLSKDFTIREQKRLQFRAEFFNLTNTPYFGKPGRTLGTATFGNITGLARGGTSNTRTIQLALKFIF
jgi:hypothetical protein